MNEQANQNHEEAQAKPEVSEEQRQKERDERAKEAVEKVQKKGVLSVSMQCSTYTMAALAVIFLGALPYLDGTTASFPNENCGEDVLRTGCEVIMEELERDVDFQKTMLLVEDMVMKVGDPTTRLSAGIGMLTMFIFLKYKGIHNLLGHIEQNARQRRDSAIARYHAKENPGHAIVSGPMSAKQILGLLRAAGMNAEADKLEAGLKKSVN